MHGSWRITEDSAASQAAMKACESMRCLELSREDSGPQASARVDTALAFLPLPSVCRDQFLTKLGLPNKREEGGLSRKPKPATEKQSHVMDGSCLANRRERSR